MGDGWTAVGDKRNYGFAQCMAGWWVVRMANGSSRHWSVGRVGIGLTCVVDIEIAGWWVRRV